MPFSDLFGKTLQKQAETVDTDTHLEGKHVMVYFSAHWCPPCRGFTPVLGEFYKKFQETSSKPFEIIFASSDKDEASFKEYYDEMPWTAIPYSERDIKAKLSAKYKVQGIPTLVVLDPQGELITNKGREKVSSDPEGKDFPWTPKTLWQILDGELQSKSGAVAVDTLKNKYFGIYFSAHWCPPCRGFTPVLVETYNKLKAAGKEFEVIFVSSDRDEKSYNEYYNEMPWLSLGFKDSRSSELSDICDVEGIPQLTLVGEDGAIISNNGRSFVDGDKDGNEFPWSVKPLQQLSMCGDEINSEFCVVAISPNENTDDLFNILNPIAVEQVEKQKNSKDMESIHFFYSSTGGLADRICSLFSITIENDPIVAFLHIPNGFTTCNANAEEINATINSFRDGTLSLNPMPSR